MFNQNDPNQNAKEIKPRRKGLVFWTLLIILLLFFSAIFAKAYNFGNKIFTGQSLVSSIGRMILSGPEDLEGEAKGRINILLLGYGGAEHDGPYLTDSIILASVDPQAKQVLLTTIPRDYLWKNGEQIKKLNFVYFEAFVAKEDHGQAGLAVRKAVEEISGQKIPYFASLDFNGFKKAVDRVGGLEINVERSFTDPTFPDDKTYGYLPPITFEAGEQLMNGDKALKYVRSRHADGIEGSDFARSQRQAKVIEAFKEKIQKLSLFSDPKTINDLGNIFADHFHTNLKPSEMLHLYELMNSAQTRIYSQSLDPNSGLLCEKVLETETDKQYIVLPCEDNDKKRIKEYFDDGFKYMSIREEKASIILENAGTDSELYKEVKSKLLSAGLEVYETPYRGLPLRKSVLYRVNGAKPGTEKYIEEMLDIRGQEKPEEMTAKTDLVLIVGGAD